MPGCRAPWGPNLRQAFPSREVKANRRGIGRITKLRQYAIPGRICDTDRTSELHQPPEPGIGSLIRLRTPTSNAPTLEMEAPTLEMERPTQELKGATLEMELVTLEMEAPFPKMNDPFP